MVRGRKSGEGSRLRKPHGVKKISNEPIPTTRVLRSHKRKIAEQQGSNVVNLVEKRRKRSVLGDSSDCIVLSDTESLASNEDVNNAVTSTPICVNDRKRPIFNIGSIETPQNAEPDNDPVDVIVISDSSAVTPTVVVLSDENESDVEVIHSAIQEPKPASLVIRGNPEPEEKKKEDLTCIINNENARVPPQRDVPNVNPEKVPANRTKFKSKKRRVDRRYKLCDRFREQRTGIRDPCYFGRNIYIENPIALPKTGLRPVIIDGSNVAFHHSNNAYFSCKGLEICIKYFKIRGHEVIAFVPHYRVKYNESDNPRLLDLLVKSGDVVLTPSRTVNGSLVVSYDDRFIVQTAVVKGGVIVTRDNYRDLLDENPLWAETIKYRLLQFTWVQDLLMFPNDPLGRRGPSLEEFLRFG